MITSQNSTNHRSPTNQQTYLIPTMQFSWLWVLIP